MPIVPVHPNPVLQEFLNKLAEVKPQLLDCIVPGEQTLIALNRIADLVGYTADDLVPGERMAPFLNNIWPYILAYEGEGCLKDSDGEISG